MRILLVTPYLPHPEVAHGGGQAIRGQATALARRHDCTVISLLRPGEERHVEAAAAQGFALRTVPFVDRQARGLARLGLLSRRVAALGRVARDRYPLYAAKYHDASLERTVIAAAAALRPDVIQVEYLQLAYLLRRLRCWRDALPAAEPGPRLILSSHEVSSLPRRRRAAVAGPGQRRWLLVVAGAWDRLARDASDWADATLCVTDQDRALLATAGGHNLVTVPLGIAVPPRLPVTDPATPPRILFLGSFAHGPNRSAADVLCRRLWPGIAPRLPGWELVLAGAGSREFLAGIGNTGAPVRALGFVNDLSRVLADSRLLAAPLLEGGGIKIKILEAMAHGLPIVTTPIGAEGIVTREDDLVWWADDADAFPAALLAAASDPQAAAERAARAHRHVAEHFSWDAVCARLEPIYRGGPLA